MPNICLTFSTQAAASNVQQALTTLEGLASWWTNDTTGTPVEGGKLVFTFGNNGGFVMHVLKSTAEQVAWQCMQGPDEWLGTHIEFTLIQQPTHCQLMFRHAGWAAEVPFFYHCSTKWATFLLSLRDYVEQGRGRPFPNDLKIEANGM
jgi:hypothetical protein